jgi:hypothetical protein
MDFIHKDEITEDQSNWSKFGDFYFKNKKALINWLSHRRKYPDAPNENTHPHLFDRNPQRIRTYMGNPNVKAPYSEMEYTEEQIKEYQRCAADPIYFAETYVRILSVDFGEIPFTLYDFQRGMINEFNDRRFNICKLPRQCGKSTTSVAFILWYSLFNPAKTIGILANKGELAQEILGRLQLAYELLPFWLQQGCVTYNKRSMELENGSKIIATSSSGSAARGMSFSLIFLDEFAFVPPNDAEDFFRSVYPTISSGSDTKMIIVSTPKGMNHFYKMWTEAKEGRSSFNPIEINWWDVPGRDENWKEQQIRNTSEEQFQQEFVCDFVGSSSTLISATKLQSMSYIKPIRTVEGVDFYDEPKPGHNYMVTVDCARGLRLDYSAFVVIDVSSFPYKLVAKYRNNEITPIIYPQFIKNIASYYNNAWVLVEANDVGAQVVDTLYNALEYENVLKTINLGRAGWQLGSGAQAKLGVTTSASVKTKGCSNLKSFIETDKLIIEDLDTFTELTTFVRKGESSVGSNFAADAGANDDLVMCLVLFCWAIMSKYWKEISETDIVKKSIEDHIDSIEEDEDGILPLGWNTINNNTYEYSDSGDIWLTVEDTMFNRYE